VYREDEGGGTHVGAVNVKSKKCEDCGPKQPNFGLPAEGKKQWCAGCAKGHVGAVDLRDKRRNIKRA
jgi:hypothetical protein